MHKFAVFVLVACLLASCSSAKTDIVSTPAPAVSARTILAL